MRLGPPCACGLSMAQKNPLTSVAFLQPRRLGGAMSPLRWPPSARAIRTCSPPSKRRFLTRPARASSARRIWTPCGALCLRDPSHGRLSQNPRPRGAAPINAAAPRTCNHALRQPSEPFRQTCTPRGRRRALQPPCCLPICPAGHLAPPLPRPLLLYAFRHGRFSLPFDPVHSLRNPLATACLPCAPRRCSGASLGPRPPSPVAGLDGFGPSLVCDTWHSSNRWHPSQSAAQRLQLPRFGQEPR